MEPFYQFGPIVLKTKGLDLPVSWPCDANKQVIIIRDNWYVDPIDFPYNLRHPKYFCLFKFQKIIGSKKNENFILYHETIEN